MPKKPVVQRHHISYDPEVVVTLRKNEHWILTQMHRQKTVSQGFLTALKVYLALHEHEAIDLDAQEDATL